MTRSYIRESRCAYCEAITPYIDYLYKFDQKKSLRTEVQYMSTEQDYGSWLYGLAEFSISPHWLFELSDMYNIAPTVKEDGKEGEKLHYPTAGVVYSAGSTRYSLRYVKQVEGSGLFRRNLPLGTCLQRSEIEY